jgi:hypothetical protein
MWYKLGDTLPTPVPRSSPIAGGAADSAPCCSNPGTVGQNLVNAANIVANTDVSKSYRFPGGAFNTALDIAGPASTVTVVRPTTAITFEKWVYTETPSVGLPQALLVTGNNNLDEAYSLYIDTNQKFRCAIDTSSTFVNVEAPSIVAASTIYYVACTYDGATVALYVNGTSVASASATGAINYVGAYGTTVGGPVVSDGASENFGGVMAQVAIYSTALSSTRILAHYNAGSGATPPTPPPTPAPTPTPIAAATPSNGPDWPYTSVAINQQGSPIWASPLPEGTTFPTYNAGSGQTSAAIVTNLFTSPSGVNNSEVIGQEPGLYDLGRSIYFTAPTDPTINVTCTGGGCPGAGSAAFPATMQIPKNMRFGSSETDNAVGIVQQNGTEIDVYYYGTYGTPTQPPFCTNVPCSGNVTWGSSGYTTLTVGDGGTCGNFFSGLGMMGNSTANHNLNNVAGACTSAGNLHPNEIEACVSVCNAVGTGTGSIKHALYLDANCWSSTQPSVYPVPGTSGDSACSNTGEVAPVPGSRLHYKPTCAATYAVFGGSYKTAILCALHQYGGYYMDSCCGGGTNIGMGFNEIKQWGLMAACTNGYESDLTTPCIVGSNPNPWSVLGPSPNGWSSFSVGSGAWGPRWAGENPMTDAAIFTPSNWEIISPCVTAQTWPASSSGC